MVRERSVPEVDLKLINDSFKADASPVETLGKDSSGRLLDAKRQVVNKNGYTISDFTGRKLIHTKSLVPVTGPQFIVGVKGQRYEDIPIDLRQQIVWVESDFE